MLIFGWSVHEILSMPAVTFFALLTEGRRIKFMEESRRYANLCDVQSISLGDAGYFEKVRNVFYNFATGSDSGKTKALDPTDPLTVSLVESMTMQASRLQ